MEILGGKVLPFIFVLTILVFVHELGHYLAARWNGVRVEVFSIGFGKELFGWTDKNGTRWRFSLIPVGGYVRMFGDADGSSRPDSEQISALTEEDRQYSLHGKKPWQKIVVSAAGPFANFLFAIIALMGLFMLSGIPVEGENGAIVGKVIEGKAANKAGIHENDRIVGIDDKPISKFSEFYEIIREKPNQKIMLDVIRPSLENPNNPLRISLMTEEVKINSKKSIGQIGIQQGFEFKKLNPLHASVKAITFSYDMCANMLNGIWEIITQKRSSKELGGIFTIGDMAGQSFKSGLIPLLMFMIMLSLNLGLINLLPIPMLDGGHIVFSTIEIIKGSPVSAKASERAYFVGFLLVASLMLVAMWNDIIRYTSLSAWLGKLTGKF